MGLAALVMTGPQKSLYNYRDFVWNTQWLMGIVTNQHAARKPTWICSAKLFLLLTPYPCSCCKAYGLSAKQAIRWQKIVFFTECKFIILLDFRFICSACTFYFGKISTKYRIQSVFSSENYKMLLVFLEYSVEHFVILWDRIFYTNFLKNVESCSIFRNFRGSL